MNKKPEAALEKLQLPPYLSKIVIKEFEYTLYNLCKPVCKVFLSAIIFFHIHNFLIFCLHWISITNKDHMPLHTNNTCTLLQMLKKKKEKEKRMLNPSSVLVSHMTELECEISTQTFMRTDLHYITSVSHDGCWELKEKRKNGGEIITLQQGRDAGDGKNETNGENGMSRSSSRSSG